MLTFDKYISEMTIYRTYIVKKEFKLDQTGILGKKRGSMLTVPVGSVIDNRTGGFFIRNPKGDDIQIPDGVKSESIIRKHSKIA